MFVRGARLLGFLIVNPSKSRLRGPSGYNPKYFTQNSKLSTTTDRTYRFTVTKESLQGKPKARLDAFLAVELSGQVSRSKIQDCIERGLVLINGQPAGSKSSVPIRLGDAVTCNVPPPEPLKAHPEQLPLEVVFEDDYLLVVVKAAGMVVHVSPGHHSGTLTNAVLGHCRRGALSKAAATIQDGFVGSPVVAAFNPLACDLPIFVANEEGGNSSDGDDDDPHSNDNNNYTQCLWSSPVDRGGGNNAVLGGGGKWGERKTSYSSPCSSLHRELGREQNEFAKAKSTPREGEEGFRSSGSHSGGAGPGDSLSGSLFDSAGLGGPLRPGIVHRLDKGTSGLLVVAKTPLALERLSAQFQTRTVDRIYHSVCLGCPAAMAGVVKTNIGRDTSDRKKMAALPYGSAKGRVAISNYKVVEQLANGRAALVQWRLETGRTHQIRVHGRHLGHPLFADDAYSGGEAPALDRLVRQAALGRGGTAQPLQKVRDLLQQFKDRPALHALTLGFTHPFSNERMSFKSELPKDMKHLLAVLREL